jgi:hypothetical protein
MAAACCCAACWLRSSRLTASSKAEAARQISSGSSHFQRGRARTAAKVLRGRSIDAKQQAQLEGEVVGVCSMVVSSQAIE